MKSSSPFGPAAKPSIVVNSWTMTFRMTVTFLERG